MEIHKSEKLAQVKIIAVSIVALLLVLLANSIIRAVNDAISIDVATGGFILRTVVILTGIGAVIVTWLHFKQTTYALDGKNLVITHTRFMQSEDKQIIPLDSSPISKLGVQQTYFGKSFGYGTITVEYENLKQKKIVTLVGVEEPQNVLSEMQSRLSK